MKFPAYMLALAGAFSVTAAAAQTPTPETAPAGAPATPVGEPLPPGAPTADYELTAWCFGAMSEYLQVYDQVKPELRDIDKLFGTSVKGEKDPYHQDMAAARDELKVLSGGVEAAEKASPAPISEQGAAAVKQGRSIWHPAEGKTKRELARAWLSWGLPDRCDSTARDLTSRSALLGQALRYNASKAATTDAAAIPAAEPAGLAQPSQPAPH